MDVSNEASPPNLLTLSMSSNLASPTHACYCETTNLVLL